METTNPAVTETGSGNPSSERKRDIRLPSLEIRGFRGIDHLVIPRMGNATLLYGRNNVGKSTVLDALHLYSRRANHSVLIDLLDRHDESIGNSFKNIEEGRFPDFSPLFHNDSHERPIAIGPHRKEGDMLFMEESFPRHWHRDALDYLDEWDVFKHSDGDPFESSKDWPPLRFLRVRMGNETDHIPWAARSSSHPESNLFKEDIHKSVVMGLHMMIGSGRSPLYPCWELRPGPDMIDDVILLWPSIALTEFERLTIDSLNMAHHQRVESISLIGTRKGGDRPRFIVKLEGKETPVPLKRLGDGALKMLLLAVGLVGSRNGLLLVDEIENGLHHSLQADCWRMIFKQAQAHDIQVVATSHSWDVVKGFAEALVEHPGIEGRIARLERDGNHLSAVEYTRDEIQIIIDQMIEIR